MNQEILNFLKDERIGVLAIEMLDGAPHAATLHFAYDESSGMLFFKTSRSYRKSEPLFGRPTSRASFVVGVNESIMKSFQADGEVRLITDDEKDLFERTFLGKFPEKKKTTPDPDAVFFVFIPTWWRYTDWTKPEGKVVIVSDQ